MKALEAKAKKDKGLERGLKKITAGANRVVKAPETVDGFIATLYLLDELEGLLYGYDYYVDKDWRNDWVNVATWTAWWDPYDGRLVDQIPTSGSIPPPVGRCLSGGRFYGSGRPQRTGNRCPRQLRGERAGGR